MSNMKRLPRRWKTGWSEVKWSEVMLLNSFPAEWKWEMERRASGQKNLPRSEVCSCHGETKREGVGRQIENNHHSIQHTIHSESINLNPFSKIIMRNCYSEMLQMSRTSFGIPKFLFIYMCKVNTRQPTTLNECQVLQYLHYCRHK